MRMQLLNHACLLCADMAMLGRGSALQRTATSTSAPALSTSRRPARRAASAALVTEAPQLKPQSRNGNGNGVVGTNGPTIINGQVDHPAHADLKLLMPPP
jgi:hypothetical protein